jgi:7,8-dihydropterin-6-yl-methyl-4-(beta-D-ribofuranosyl)aminobenzene 5'-phosphate synthase
MLPGILALLLWSTAGLGARPVQSLKVTVLSTMLADGEELGEWGFAALVEVDGHRLLFDTGAKTDVVLKNVESLKLDLSDVPDLILSHWHWDHVGGFMTLRNAARAKQATALARTHVAEGFFDSRIGTPPGVELNQMIRLRPDYEATGGTFRIHGKPVELFAGVWLTGPVPRKHPERNWSGNVQVRTATGVREDTLNDDMALVVDTAQGLVVVTGCGHAGVINILEQARTVVRPARVHALIGGLHLFRASEPTLTWTAGKLREFGLENLIGAHCTGVETVYRLRADAGLDRAHAVVGAVGQVFQLGQGIDARVIAK